MDYPSSCIPFTSDPAICDDWDPGHERTPIQPSNSHSDDLEALHLIHEETKAQKTKEGIVIQHRAWKIEEVFRSDADHPLETPLRLRSKSDLSNTVPPSPATSFNMPCSSPPSYPDSPPTASAKRPAAKAMGAFLDFDSDEEDAFNDLPEQPVAKRPKIDAPKQTSHSILRSIPVPNAPKTQIDLPEATKLKPAGAFVLDDDSDDDIASALSRDLQSQIQAATQLDSQASPRSTCSEDTHSYLAPLPSYLSADFGKKKEIRTCSGKAIRIPLRQKTASESYEQMIAARSTTKAGRAKRDYYGINILQLKEDAKKTIAAEEAERAKQPATDPEAPLPTTEVVGGKSRRTHMWTEKYRARRFFDLCGDDRTHREVLRWLKRWDPIVFSASAKVKAKPAHKRPDLEGQEDEHRHRKILLLTGPPGLGKTTLAHVCAQQAGYEIMEINASDDRSANVVKGRIRTSVGTESVKTVSAGGPPKPGEKVKPVRPVCVVVDEVDGVVSGGGPSGEGGFVKALIDLVELDAKNTSSAGVAKTQYRKKKHDEQFRLLRPLILICNDVYHPSLRPLRQSGHAEIIHIRKPPLDAVVKRMKNVFEKEGILCDADAICKLCESTWGMQSGPDASKSSGSGEGDIRSVLVVGEWIARKLRSEQKAHTTTQPKLTKKWIERHLSATADAAEGGARGVARGGSKEVVSRVFITGAGFPVPAASAPPTSSSKSSSLAGDVRLAPTTKLHAAEVAKKHGISKLREMVDTSDEHDRIISDVFATFPTQQFNDDTILSKPDKAYEWLHFYNQCSHGVFQEQSHELVPYLSQPILACHDLFAAPARSFGQAQKSKWDKNEDNEEKEEELPYTGLKAEYDCREVTKRNREMLEEMLNSLKDENHIHREKDAGLLRSLRGPENMATELLPWLIRIISPDVKPVVVGGSGENRGVASVRREGEREMVRRAVDVMAALGVSYQRGKLEAEFGAQTQWVYRMDP